LYRQAKTVMFFVTHGSEIATERMIERAWKDGKKVVVPLVDKTADVLRGACIASLCRDLAPGAYGVREPIPGRCRFVKKKDIDLVVVPGVAFDMTGHRLGYGKGYYDRWLKGFAIRQRLGLCFDFQVVERLPHGGHDQQVGSIVTDRRMIVAGRRGRRRIQTELTGIRTKGVVR
jgi:5-formyltetrahydrofolate cyclo-ligase